MGHVVLDTLIPLSSALELTAGHQLKHEFLSLRVIPNFRDRIENRIVLGSTTNKAIQDFFVYYRKPILFNTMPGEGSMQQMINSLKYNNSLRNRSAYFDTKNHFYRVASKKGLTYKTATPEQLAEIRQTIKAQRKAENRKQVVFAIVSVCIVAVLLWVGYDFLLSMMEGDYHHPGFEHKWTKPSFFELFM